MHVRLTDHLGQANYPKEIRGNLHITVLEDRFYPGKTQFRIAATDPRVSACDVFYKVGEV